MTTEEYYKLLQGSYNPQSNVATGQILQPTATAQTLQPTAQPVGNLPQAGPVANTPPTVSAPQPPAAPKPVVQPTQQKPQQPQRQPQPNMPAQQPITPQQPQSNPFALQQVMTALENNFKSNNSLMDQRNLVLRQLYDQPLTPDELNKLDPSLKAAVQSGDRNQIDLQLRLISDQVAGRTNTVDQSMQYLVQAYQQQVQQADTQRQQAIDNVIKFAQTYGSNAKSALSSLYGPQYVEQLKQQAQIITQRRLLQMSLKIWDLHRV